MIAHRVEGDFMTLLEIEHLLSRETPHYNLVQGGEQQKVAIVFWLEVMEPESLIFR